MRSLVRAVAKLLRIWWAVDRIRASPTEARLFELQPPCVAMIDGEAVEVLARRVEEGRIVYECVRPGGVDRLLVIPGDLTSRPVVRWIGVDSVAQFHDGTSELRSTCKPIWE